MPLCEFFLIKLTEICVNALIHLSGTRISPFALFFSKTASNMNKITLDFKSKKKLTDISLFAFFLSGYCYSKAVEGIPGLSAATSM